MMMMPAYLPFATPNGATVDAMSHYFETLLIYRPQDDRLPGELDSWMAAGRIAVRVPVADGDERLQHALAACAQWARERDLGAGSAGAFLKAQPAGAPFHDEDSVGRLRRQIIAGGGVEGRTAAPDPLFDARLFLAMADAHDADQANASAQLNSLRATEERLLREMHAGTVTDARIGPPVATIAAAEDRGAFMTGERLRAWAILASQAVDLPPLLATDSPAVAAELLEPLAAREGGAPKLSLRVTPQGGADDVSRRVHLQKWLAAVLAADIPDSLFSHDALGIPDKEDALPRLDLHLLPDYPVHRLVTGLLPRDLVPNWQSAEAPPRHGLLVQWVDLPE